MWDSRQGIEDVREKSNSSGNAAAICLVNLPCLYRRRTHRRNSALTYLHKLHLSKGQSYLKAHRIRTELLQPPCKDVQDVLSDDFIVSLALLYQPQPRSTPFNLTLDYMV